jgi:FeS assembly SUF system protein
MNAESQDLPDVALVGDPTVLTRAVDALQTVFDPEIPLDIYQLGLIYKLDLDESGTLLVTMTLTTPMCPEAQSLPAKVEETLSVVEGVKYAQVDLVWEPPWGPERMTEAARLTLGF